MDTQAVRAYLLDPPVELVVRQSVEFEPHVREARAAVVGREPVIDARPVDHRMKLGFHARHGIDHARQRRHEERIHDRGRCDPERDGPVDRGGQLVDGGNALLGIDEQPLPVHCHHLNGKRLGLGGHRTVLIQPRQRPIRIELMGADPGDGAQRDDDQERRGPDGQLQHGGMIPIGVVVRVLSALPIPPCKQQGQNDHRDDDQQHQTCRDDDQVPLSHRHVASRRQQHGIATACEGHQQGNCCTSPKRPSRNSKGCHYCIEAWHGSRKWRFG